jgi:hypothetical protein
MDVYASLQPELDAAWEAIEQRVGAWPDAVAGLGRRFLSFIDDAGAGHRSYFSSALSPPLLYIPLWLRERFRREGAWAPPADALIPGILAAAMWGYFYIRIQDNQIDDPEHTDPELLLFGNLCIEQLHRLLHAAFNGSPEFWAAFDRAWIEFTRFTLQERRQLMSDLPYSRELFEAHATKVAFARVPALAVCSLAGRMDLEPCVTELVHRLGIAYGLVNDMIGWPRDLRAGHRTYLLARAGVSHRDIRTDREQTPMSCGEGEARPVVDELRRRLYDAGLLRAVLDEAAHWQERAQAVARDLGLVEFEQYTRERLRWLRSQEAHLQWIQLQRALVPAGDG